MLEIRSKEEETSLDAPVPLMRWKATCECPVCQSNSNVVRAEGLPFPSGHTSAPAHTGCTCGVEAVEPTREQVILDDLDQLAHA